MACRLPLETIWFRQAATRQQPAQHPRWSSPAQSPAKIAGAQIASLPAVVLVMATAPVQNGGIGAFEGASQPPMFPLRRSFESAQYVSIRYTERLAEAGIEPSVGSVGDSYDCESVSAAWRA